MKFSTKITTFFLVITEIFIAFIILFLPLSILESLSLEVVGEPPINGRTWIEGVDELGGEFSMRLLGIIGLFIMVHTVILVLNWENKPLPERNILNIEILLFLIVTASFFIINLMIGYEWWDPNGFLGMGPLFFHSILSLIVLGCLPTVFRKIFRFNKEDFANSTSNFENIFIAMFFIAFGYGLLSSIWHCCSFYEPKMYFFFFVIKLIQLWAMCSFFFKYGLNMLLSRTKPWLAIIIISVLFGFCYPWHTLGFAFVFVFFGLGLCILTRKTDSYLPGLILLYLAYIFHAGIPWNGPFITFAIIFPISIIILGILFISNFKISS